MFPDVASPIRRKKNTISISLFISFLDKTSAFFYFIFLKRVKAIKSIISQSSSRVHLPLCSDTEPEQSNKGGKILSTA